MSRVSPEERPTPDVVVCPGGPVLLRGEHLVRDDDGVEHRTVRPVSALCRCGKTASKPWCDGTHRVIPDQHRP